MSPPFPLAPIPVPVGLPFIRWVILALTFVFPLPVIANPVVTEHTQAQLISEVKAIRPGTSFWLALHLQLHDGWHTYWRNPGDTGLPTTLDWSLPEGFTASPIHWPYPEAIPYGSLMNYGYHDEVALLIQITPPDALPNATTVTLAAQAKWLVCKETCVPEEAMLALALPVTHRTSPLAERWQPVFAEARQALPDTSPWPVSFTTAPKALVLHLPSTELTKENVENLRFFPWTDQVIDYTAPQTLINTSDRMALTIGRGKHRDTPLERVRGVLVLRAFSGPDTEVRAWRIEALPAATQAGSGTGEPAEAAAPTVLPDIAPVIDVSSESLRKELLFAFLGGLILNLMPCVFPVLSIKALSLVKKSQQAPWEVRRHGMVFTLGVLTCFLVIAGVLLILRYSGAQLGWGFQLQSPIVVTLLAYLMFAVGLSLSGVFTLGSSLMGLGSGVAAKPGYLGSFATGMLATLVATPCTAPFMGTALGFALTQPWAVGLAVFMTLGFGLAFPYLLLSFFPPLFRFLPKPGPWMVRFKELLAFPMYATAAWLIWVLTLQTGSEGIVTALFGLILIAFAAWLFNCTRLPSQGWRRAGNVGTVAVLLMALGLVELPVFEQSDTPSPHRTGEGPEWQPFSQERLAALRAQGKPVFINFSAAWCITCLTNERVALKSSRLAKAFEENGIVYLKADWTNRNPKITAVLSSFGRTGVPLYVYYPPKADKLVILPQILTEAIILEYLNLIGGPGIFENVYY